MAVALSGLLRASPRHVRTCSATSVSVTKAMTRMRPSQRGHTRMSVRNVRWSNCAQEKRDVTLATAATRAATKANAPCLEGDSATSGGLGCGAMRERRRLLGPKTP